MKPRREPPEPASARPTVHAISLPTAHGDRTTNAYLLPGAPTALIDPGPDTAEARDALAAACGELGAPIDTVGQIVVTHTHPDHCGMTGWLQGRTGARVLCHPMAAPALARMNEALDARLALLLRAASASGVAADVAEAASRHWQSRSGTAVASVPEAALWPAREGARVRLGGAEWAVLHCPGHARDHLCLVHRPSGALFSGDLLLRHRRATPWLEARRADGTRPTTLADLVRSLQRLSRQRVAIAWPGHGRAIRAHRMLIARRLAELRQELKTARLGVAAGASTIVDVARDLDLALNAEALFASLSEAVALTDWLVERDLVERRTSDGLIRLSTRRA